MLDMLVDMFEWPIAVDNWETNYGKTSFSTHTVTHSRCVMYSEVLVSYLSYFFCSSGKTWRLEDVISKMNEKYGTPLLVNFFVGTDDRDSNSHIIHVGVQL